MTLQELVDQVEGFESLPPRETIRLFVWWLHVHGGRESADNIAVRACYNQVHLPDPNVSTYTARMLKGSPPDLIRVGSGFKLHRDLRLELDKKYGLHESVVTVMKDLANLPAKVPSMVERIFLDETITCYRHKAYRAAVVMAWNLAYSHFLHWVLNDAARLAKFNGTIKTRYPKSNAQIATYDDFEQLKEFEVIEVANSAALVNSGIVKIMREKLGRRNTAAHPSTVTIIQSQADDVITDLVNNVVLALT